MVVSIITDIILPKIEEKNYITVIIITSMVMISGVLRFVQETRSGNAVAQLKKMISTNACIERIEQDKQEIPNEDIVVGDIVYLFAGDLILVNVRFLSAKDLFISQSALTGESEPVEKFEVFDTKNGVLTDKSNLAFMGSTVISGSAKAVVVSVGNDTMLGFMAKTLN